MNASHVEIGRGFRRSRRCETANCVEVDTDRIRSGSVYVRDSTAPGVLISFPTDDWSTFITALKTA
ncbi:hypothetical protein J2S43_006059 [Catenuloplanes nepalensis]|uniref:DUF397 domain-containing protein n=1 Tax=Catenuloplanes nepalensis TaxID=587533 RepID=A0ABT9N1G8_9ACTN|nr:hypothetical protein [Catenuloplanes nepalensis]